MIAPGRGVAIEVWIKGGGEPRVRSRGERVCQGKLHEGTRGRCVLKGEAGWGAREGGTCARVTTAEQDVQGTKGRRGGPSAGAQETRGDRPSEGSWPPSRAAPGRAEARSAAGPSASARGSSSCPSEYCHLVATSAPTFPRRVLNGHAN